MELLSQLLNGFDSFSNRTTTPVNGGALLLPELKNSSDFRDFSHFEILPLEARLRSRSTHSGSPLGSNLAWEHEVAPVNAEWQLGACQCLRDRQSPQCVSNVERSPTPRLNAAKLRHAINCSLKARNSKNAFGGVEKSQFAPTHTRDDKIRNNEKDAREKPAAHTRHNPFLPMALRPTKSESTLVIPRATSVSPVRLCQVVRRGASATSAERADWAHPGIERLAAVNAPIPIAKILNPRAGRTHLS